VVHNPLALAPTFRAPSAAGSPVLAMTSISCVIVQVCLHMLDFIVRVALPAAFERLPFPHPGPSHCWRFQSQHARPHTLTNRKFSLSVFNRGLLLPVPGSYQWKTAPPGKQVTDCSFALCVELETRTIVPHRRVHTSPHF
jgi:hypothetical protein